MLFLVKLNIAIFIVFAITSALFLEDTKSVLGFPVLHVLGNRHGGVHRKQRTGTHTIFGI
uniref:hypothetical protein n=1 Tax=Escherichia coli TaxID=562 RepID=UPI00201F19F3|nr:hypothetical protein [Escherichia coli]